MLDYLVNELGVDPVARDKSGMSSVHAATQGGQPTTVKVSVLHNHTLAAVHDCKVSAVYYHI